ncbi:hypothetical protein NDA16_001585 [Ustilago loliicola]|nr:hypothetical protein NDA16_001585 [Ustilago loliicola]
MPSNSSSQTPEEGQLTVQLNDRNPTERGVHLAKNNAAPSTTWSELVNALAARGAIIGPNVVRFTLPKVVKGKPKATAKNDLMVHFIRSFPGKRAAAIRLPEGRPGDTKYINVETPLSNVKASAIVDAAIRDKWKVADSIFKVNNTLQSIQIVDIWEIQVRPNLPEDLLDGPNVEDFWNFNNAIAVLFRLETEHESDIPDIRRQQVTYGSTLQASAEAFTPSTPASETDQTPEEEGDRELVIEETNDTTPGDDSDGQVENLTRAPSPTASEGSVAELDAPGTNEDEPTTPKASEHNATSSQDDPSAVPPTSSVYLPANVPGRQQLVADGTLAAHLLPSNLTETELQQTVVIGDFNEMEAMGDSFKLQKRPHSLWQEIMDAIQPLVPIFRRIHPTKEVFSFFRLLGLAKITSSDASTLGLLPTVTAATRIDHCFMHEAIILFVHDVQYIPEPGASDHCALIVNGLLEPHLLPPSNRLFKIHRSALLDTAFKAKLTINLQDVPLDATVATFRDFMSNIKLTSFRHLQALRIPIRSIDQELEQARSKLSNLSLTKESMDELAVVAVHYERLRAFAFPEERGDFLRLQPDELAFSKKRHKKQSIPIKPDEVSAFFQDLFLPPPETDACWAATAQKFLRNSQVQIAKPEDLVEPFTGEELFLTLKKFKKDSATGPNVIPVDAFIAGGRPFSTFLEEVLNSVLGSKGEGVEPFHFSVRGSLLFKAKPGSEVENVSDYRALSIMDVEARLLHAVVGNRLKNKLKDAIPSSQQGFLPGRQGALNVIQLLVIAECNTRGLLRRPAIIISQDQHKAYDVLSRDWILLALQTAGAPIEFVNLIDSLWRDSTLSFTVEEGDCPPVLVGRGLPQGVIFSVMLYLIAYQPFLDAWEAARGSISLHFGETSFRLSSISYADNSDFFLGSKQDLTTFMNLRLIDPIVANEASLAASLCSIFTSKDTQLRNSILALMSMTHIELCGVPLTTLLSRTDAMVAQVEKAHASFSRRCLFTFHLFGLRAFMPQDLTKAFPEEVVLLPFHNRAYKFDLSGLIESEWWDECTELLSRFGIASFLDLLWRDESLRTPAGPGPHHKLDVLKIRPPELHEVRAYHLKVEKLDSCAGNRTGKLRLQRAFKLLRLNWPILRIWSAELIDLLGRFVESNPSFKALPLRNSSKAHPHTLRDSFPLPVSFLTLADKPLSKFTAKAGRAWHYGSKCAMPGRPDDNYKGAKASLQPHRLRTTFIKELFRFVCLFHAGPSKLGPTKFDSHWLKGNELIAMEGNKLVIVDTGLIPITDEDSETETEVEQGAPLVPLASSSQITRSDAPEVQDWSKDRKATPGPSTGTPGPSSTQSSTNADPSSSQSSGRAGPTTTPRRVRPPRARDTGAARHSLGCYVASILVLIALRVYYMDQNRRKRRANNVLKGRAEDAEDEIDLSQTFLDLTDKKNINFRYSY